MVRILTSFLFYAGLALLFVINQKNLIKQQVLGVSKQEIPQTFTAQQLYWQKIITAHPDYRDSYLQLGLIFYQLGDNEKAKELLQKALNLDPNNITLQSYLQLVE